MQPVRPARDPLSHRWQVDQPPHDGAFARWPRRSPTRTRSRGSSSVPTCPSALCGSRYRTPSMPGRDRAAVRAETANGDSFISSALDRLAGSVSTAIAVVRPLASAIRRLVWNLCCRLRPGVRGRLAFAKAVQLATARRGHRLPKWNGVRHSGATPHFPHFSLDKHFDLTFAPRDSSLSTTKPPLAGGSPRPAPTPKGRNRGMLSRTRLRLVVFLLLAGTAYLVAKMAKASPTCSVCQPESTTQPLCALSESKKHSWCGASCGAGHVYEECVEGSDSLCISCAPM